MKNIDVEAAVETYYSTFVISAGEIMKIFGCGRTTASKLRREAAEFAVSRGEPLPSMNEVAERSTPAIKRTQTEAIIRKRPAPGWRGAGFVR